MTRTFRGDTTPAGIGASLSRGFTLLELVLVIAIIALLLGLGLPAILHARDASSRVECSNHLHQIGLALHQYHDVRGSLPPGVSTNEAFHPSWHVHLLPYLEQDALAADARRSAHVPLPITGPDPGSAHQGLRTVLPVFGCPADGRVSSTYNFFGLEVALTSYIGVQGLNRARRNGLLYENSHVRFRDIKDGTSHTLAVGERPPYPPGLWGVWYSGIWGVGPSGTGSVVLGVREPCAPPFFGNAPCGNTVFRFGPGSINNSQDAYHFWSLHHGGANFLFADGATHFMSYSAEGVMAALASRAGGEVVDYP